MSKLDELIKKLCPDGVEFKKLGDIGTFERGRRFVHADDREEGIPCIHYGELYTHYGVWAKEVKTHINPEITTKLRYAEKNDIVIVAAGENKIDIGIAVAWLGDEKVAIHDACYIYRHNQNPIYLSYIFRTHKYHQFLKKYVAEGKICSVSSDAIAKYEIPVPPLPVQEEIARILDAFTSLTAELTAELTARRKQYEYYRDLLTEKNSYDLVSLADITSSVCKKNKGQKCKLAYSITKNGLVPTSEYFKDAKVTSDDTSGYKIVKKNWFVYSPSRIDVGSINFHKKDEDVIVSPLNVVFKINEDRIEPKYLLFFLLSHKGMFQILNQRLGIEGTGRKMLPYENFSKIKIPLPSLSEQQRIVTILDRFDSLCNDISSGLPAEIEARQKQYEYYRDKLLTFDRIEA